MAEGFNEAFTQLSGRKPIYAPEAEQAVLGGVLRFATCEHNATDRPFG